MAEPAGITRRIVLNVLETFFRHPLLHSLPLLLMLVIGVASALGHDDRFTSVSTMSASEQSLLSDVTETNAAPFGAVSPADRAVEQLGLLLGTDRFMEAIAAAAGVTVGEQPGQMTVGQLRSSLQASVLGDRLVRVSATTSGAELSRRLADQTVTAYIDHVATAGAAEGAATGRSTAALVEAARAERDRANEDVKTFLAAHPDAASEDGSPVVLQDLKLKQLEFEQAVQRYAEAKAAQDKADLEAGTASDVAHQRLVMLVPAVAATAADPVVKTIVLSVAVFVVLGILLSLASVIGASMLDHTIRVPADIEDHFGLDVVAVLPDMSP
jgi:hypothetical protein